MKTSEQNEQNRRLNAAHIALQSLDGAAEVFNAIDPD
jgi:hypothetical protein